jgi:hypothetical protein
MLATLKRRIATLESLRKKTGPKSLDDFLAEALDYARLTGVSLDEAFTRFLPDLSIDDLKRLITELESAAD